MCGVPLLNRLCREGYNDPPEVYETLQQRGMDLVTVTDHDSIDAVESLRRHTDFEPAVATYPCCRDFETRERNLHKPGSSVFSSRKDPGATLLLPPDPCGGRFPYCRDSGAVLSVVRC